MNLTGTEAARLTISVSDPEGVTGGSLDARVAVSGTLDEKVRALRVELLYVNEYQYKRRTGDDHRNHRSSGNDVVDFVSSDGDTVIDTQEEDVVVQTVTFPVADGSLVGERTVELWVPEDAPPTAGSLVRWKVRAVLDRAKGRDVNAEARVRVASTADAGAARATADPSVDDQLEIALDDRVVVLGDTVTGTLVVAPAKTAKLTDIRVEIHARRQDQDGIEHTETVSQVTVSGKTEIGAGSREEFPFELAVPIDALPSFRAANNEIEYAFVASAARRLRFDYNATVPLHVHSAPTTD